MSEGKRSIIEEITSNICDECKVCEVNAINSKGEEFLLIASYCNDGSAYITIDIYKNDELVDVCKIKHLTDDCLPMDLQLIEDHDCNCV